MIRGAPRRRSPLGLGAILVSIAALGCQYSLLFVIANATDDSVKVSFRLAVPGSRACPSTVNLNFLARSDLDRVFGEPELLPADDAHYDPAECRVEGTIPPDMALRIESPDPVSYDDAQAPGAELELSGVAGSVRLTGPQVLRFAASRGPLLFEYGSRRR